MGFVSLLLKWQHELFAGSVKHELIRNLFARRNPLAF